MIEDLPINTVGNNRVRDGFTRQNKSERVQMPQQSPRNSPPNRSQESSLEGKLEKHIEHHSLRNSWVNRGSGVTKLMKL